MSASVFVSYDAQVASLLGELRRFSSVFAPAPSPPARSVPVVWYVSLEQYLYFVNRFGQCLTLGSD